MLGGGDWLREAISLNSSALGKLDRIAGTAENRRREVTDVVLIEGAKAFAQLRLSRSAPILLQN